MFQRFTPAPTLPITLEFEYRSIELGLVALSTGLKTNSTLTTLIVSHNSIEDRGAKLISEALKTNVTLTTLSLKENEVTLIGAQALSEALKTNSTLTTLDLEGNLILDHGAEVLSVALKINSTLTTLDLQHNEIRDNGAQALSDALKTNSTLITLNLSYNLIQPNGAQALSEALKTNSTLITLNLGTNCIYFKERAMTTLINELVKDYKKQDRDGVLRLADFAPTGWAKLVMYQQHVAKLSAKNELDEFKDNPHLFWKKHKGLHDDVAAVARRFLCIQSTSCEAERVFSKAGYLTTNRKSNLSTTHLRHILFSNSMTKALTALQKEREKVKDIATTA
ncbi:hypothetical protein BGZ96_007954 [Linnemannia gamsii]|uniref:HAT C-terminal dimerisation domain-containing protein n=1 Tax=Linnemannia gamsii TaxID=64522 RepID=A0ABQ7K0B7_9FUNG|nr:hypothetical protein BGZ96_007954 [Linnemannia gamsii]